MTDKKEDFTIIVPCYNEKGSIASTIAGLLDAAFYDGAYSVIVVDDGSTDGSREVLDRLAGSDERLKIVHHSANQGYGAALKTGVNMARGDYIVITDADATYPNERIPELYGIAQDYDMVVGERPKLGSGSSVLRSVPKYFLRKWVSWIARSHVPDFNSGLRVMRREIVLKFLRLLPNTFSFTTTITLAMMTNQYRVHFEPIQYDKREGKSKIKPVRDTLRFLMLIVRTGMYFAPLRALTPFLILFAAATFVSTAYDISMHNLTDTSVILFTLTVNTGMFGLLADMIDKRS